MAKMYRKVRAENPAMARLLFRRIQKAEQEVVKAFWS
jgi:hypothetical protein